MLKINETPKLIVVGGPSGIGKSSIINYLICKNSCRYKRPLSYTSRLKKKNETESEYLFVTKEFIIFNNEKSEFANLDTVYDEYYAMTKESIDSILRNNQMPIKEIHPSNFNKLRKIYPDLISIILLPINNSFYDANSIRHKNDYQYYNKLNTSDYDIIVYNDFKKSIEQLSLQIDRYIQILNSTDLNFPRAPLIDKLNKNGYSLIAPEFIETKRVTTKNFHSLSYDFFQTAIIKYISKSSVCLEVGPGSNWIRENFHIICKKYSAVDISSEMQRYCDSSLFNSSVRSINKPDESFDVVIASLADPYFYPLALLELQRVIKRNGVIIISAPCSEWSDNIRSEAERNKTSFVLNNNSNVNVYSFTFTLAECCIILEMCGFKIIENKTAYGIFHKNEYVSPAIINSSKMTGKHVSDLPVLNLIIAKKI